MFNSKFRNFIMDCEDGIVCGLDMGGDFDMEHMVLGFPYV